MVPQASFSVSQMCSTHTADQILSIFIGWRCGQMNRFFSNLHSFILQPSQPLGAKRGLNHPSFAHAPRRPRGPPTPRLMPPALHPDLRWRIIFKTYDLNDGDELSVERIASDLMVSVSSVSTYRTIFERTGYVLLGG